MQCVDSKDFANETKSNSDPHGVEFPLVNSGSFAGSKRLFDLQKTEWSYTIKENYINWVV